VGIKKLSPQTNSFLVPEGLYVLPTPILLFQKTSQLIWANPAFEKEFGVVTDARFKTKSKLHLIQEKPVTFDVLDQVGRHEGFILESLKGKRMPVELRVSHYGDPSDETFLTLVEDMSQKVELERQLIQNHLELQKAFQTLNNTQNALVQSAKLASLGELSSGIAHELNQPLQAIMGFSQELLHVEKLSPTGTEFVTDIVNASKKMAEIIRSLRSFARDAGESLVMISVEDSVREATKLTHHSLMQRGIQLKTKIELQVPFILGNAIQLEQVMINLINNAADAIEQAGRKDGLIELHVAKSGPWVSLTVQDNGCGMTQETQDKMFDPFFTTKEVGKGTGLGLSISFGILKRFHAQTEVKSTLGKGTRFQIKFNIETAKGETA
jgi:C4-dicarboxylate-specific signal transduction histidine kinase